MRIFHDWEFLEDGETIKPISVAMISEDGWRFYRVFDDLAYHNGAMYQAVSKHPFLMSQVVPHLPLEEGTEVIQPIVEHGREAPGRFFLDRTHPAVGSKQTNQHFLAAFLADAAARDQGKIELWGWYSAYDHVCLAQLFGPMINMPRYIPFWTNDLKTRQLQLGVKDRDLPGHAGKNHNPQDEVELMRTWARWMDDLEGINQPAGTYPVPIKTL